MTVNGTGQNILPLAMRLALAYSPAAARLSVGAVFALESRLALIGSRASEPIMAQLRLAWWRDQLSRPARQWAGGEPLLALLATTGLSPQSLVGLVDGWEAVHLAPTCDRGVAESLAEGRAGVWLDLAAKLSAGADRAQLGLATNRWTFAELAGRMSGDGRGARIGESPNDHSPGPVALPRQLRSLAVLDALACRALNKGGGMLDSPMAMVLAMRVGIFGR